MTPTPPPRPPTEPVWAWKRGSGEFTPYDPEISARIEGAHAVGDKGVIIFLPAAYRIDFGKMCQIQIGDESKRRSVVRLAPDATVEKPRRTSRMDGAILATARADAVAAGIEVKKNGTVKGYHLTTPSAATSIIQSNEFHASAQGLIGPFVYFANTPEDCVGKAQAVRSLDEGALLTAQVDLGYSLVVTASPSPAVQAFLGITKWPDLTTAKLEKAGCQSVYAKAPGIVNRDEFAVPIGGAPQVTAIRLSAYHKKSSPTSSALVAVPFWQWPAWVHNLANAVQIDDAAVEAASPSTPISQPMGESYGVKINSSGRPVHSDGKFMSYAEARRRGWGGHYQVSSNPTGPTKKDGTPDMRYAANRETFLSPRASSCSPWYSGCGGGSSPWFSGGGGGGSSFSGSACYSVSSNPTGPMKMDGTPDMRYSANRG